MTVLPLTPRQEQIAALLTRGLMDKQIADELGISVGTVKTHMATILHKMGCRNRISCAVKMVRAEYEVAA